MSRLGGADFAEEMEAARDNHDNEMELINADRPQHLQETEDQLRQNAVPQVAQVYIFGMEDTPADEEPPESAAPDASPWRALRDKVETVVDGAYQRMPKEVFCQLTVELIRPDVATKPRPDHLIEAMRW